MNRHVGNARGAARCAAIALALLGGTSSGAQAAGFAVRDLAATPSTAQAGAPADLRVRLAFDAPADDVRRLELQLPPGLVGNPRATPRCAPAAFAAGSCAAATIVGTVTANVDADLGLFKLPVEAPGTIANLEPAGDEPARLGITLTPLGGLLGQIRLEAPVRLRPGDLGLTAILDELPRSFSGLSTDITALDLTLAARAGSPARPFLVLPTRCSPAALRVVASSYETAGPSTADAGLTPTGCDAVPFAPGLELAPAALAADRPGAVAVALTVPGGEEPVRQSHVRAAEVVLPEGTGLNPGVADGLEGCSAAAAASPEGCPAASRIGDVTFATPLLGELGGEVHLAAPTAERPLGLLLRVDPAGLDVRLGGAVLTDPADGRITARFDGLPQLPFTRFVLAFRGGDRAVLRAPTACRPDNRATARLTPWAGGAPADVAATVATVDCPAAAFAPSLAVRGTPAGLDVAVERPDGQARLRALRVVLPPGVAGRLGDVPPCAPAAGRAGSCPAASRIGTVRVLVGSGAAPVALTGAAFLTAPEGGALAGLAIALPARVGPLDLGTVAVTGRLDVTEGLRVAVDVPELPLLVGGIPLDLRRLELALDRPGFVTQATRCDVLEATATAVAAAGERAELRAPYTAPGCAARGLGTRVDAVAGARGATTVGAKPPLAVTLTQPEGGTNLRAASVLLPAALGVDADALGGACTEAQLAAGSCGPGATIGAARVVTPLLAAPLEGPVRIVAGPPGQLPGLAVDLTGPLRLRLRGTVALAGSGGGQLQATFPDIPDVPLTSFALRFASGKAGPLRVQQDLCGPGARPLVATLTGQGGQKRTVTTSVRAEGCRPPRPTLTARLTGARGSRPDLRLEVRTTGAPLRSVRVALPAALRTSAARGGLAVTAGGRRVKSAPRRTLRTLTVRGLPRSGSRRIAVRVRGGALRRTRALRRGTRLPITVRVVDRAGAATTLRVRVLAR